MTRYLNANGIRIFDYPDFAKALRERVRDTAAALAAEAGIGIEHVGKSHIRKEDIVARVLAQRGDVPGLVHVLSAMEACDAYKPWHDKQSHKTFIRPDSGKCLHYYFYFMDARLGLIQGNRVKECVTNGESAESMRSLDSVDGGHPWTMRHRAWTRLSRPFSTSITSSSRSRLS